PRSVAAAVRHRRAVLHVAQASRLCFSFSRGRRRRQAGPAGGDACAMRASDFVPLFTDENLMRIPLTPSPRCDLLSADEHSPWIWPRESSLAAAAAVGVPSFKIHPSSFPDSDGDNGDSKKPAAGMLDGPMAR